MPQILATALTPVARVAAALIAGSLLLANDVGASDKRPPTEPDPSALEEVTLTNHFTLGRPFNFRLLHDGSAVFFLRSGPRDRSSNLYSYDVAKNEEQLLLSVEELLGGKDEQLSKEEQAIRERKRIKTKGFTGFELSSDGSRVVAQLSGKVWLYDRATKSAARVDLPDGVILNPRLSPSGSHLSFVLDNDLYALELATKPTSGEIGGKLIRLTTDGTELRPHGLPEFVAQEEMSRHEGYWWAPTSDQIVYQSNDNSGLEQFTIADAARPEKSALVFPYPRAGKRNAEVRLFIKKIAGGTPIEVIWDREQYPYLARVVWSKRAPLSILVQDRAQQSQAFMGVDAASGRAFVLHHESDGAWLNLHKTTPVWLSDGKSFLWATEKGGGWRLDRVHVSLGRGSKAVTRHETIVPKQAGFVSLEHVDEDRGLIWFIGGKNPTERHLFRASLNGGTPRQISRAPGEHDTVFSRDGSVFVLTRATLSSMPVSEVHRSADAEKVSPTPAVITAVAEAPKVTPRVELVGPDKAGGFYAALIRPKDQDPDKKYPVVVYVYGGPGHQTVRAAMSTYFMQQWIADHGFIVVSIDGRGTPRRGRKFERAIRERFGAVPLEDQVRGLLALGEHYPELDLSRVGVYGWSFGGYMAALAVMRRPDVFKVGVAGAPVVDWVYYDTHYTERYLGLPQEKPKAYESSSLLTYADKIERPLMLVHGIADDNIYFAHTLQLADRLFAEGKAFELVPLVGSTHQLADPKTREVLYKRIVRFLGQQLW